MFKQIGLLVIFTVLSANVVGGIDTYEFDSPDGQKRYNHFIDELRCPKCKNQNLEGSNAPIAQDLRRELHRLIVEGKNDQDIVDFMVGRYGDFVLYRPPLQKNTYILWYGPVFMLLLGIVILALIIYRRSKTPNSNGGLTDGEQESFETFLNETASSPDSTQSKNSNKK
ncbi:MAG TPA: cytochrome c-type biogenesis protein [Marinagarivorans sp.]